MDFTEKQTLEMNSLKAGDLFQLTFNDMYNEDFHILMVVLEAEKISNLRTNNDYYRVRGISVLNKPGKILVYNVRPWSKFETLSQ